MRCVKWKAGVELYWTLIGKIIGSLRSNDPDGNGNVKKTIGFKGKATALHMHHTFLYISFPVFARLLRENG